MVKTSRDIINNNLIESDVVRDMDYVINETNNLSKQLKQLKKEQTND